MRTAVPQSSVPARLGLFAVPSVALLGAACLSTVEPPLPTEMATVSFPDQLFLAAPSASQKCRGLYEVPSTSTAIDQLVALDGSSARPSDAREPYNCFVRVETNGELPVDVHEVTNLQFQLCVDSGACSGPDPSKVEKTSVCSSESGFDNCPVVDVAPGAAEDYCEWVGRRLPSGLESVMVRQAGTSRRSDGLPSEVRLLPHTDRLPVTCDDAVVSNGGCDRPQPVRRGGDIGAAAGDALAIADGNGNGTVFDLVGNVAELLADLEPSTRGNANGLPWFCVAALPERNQNPPTCPENTACVFGAFEPEGLPYGQYPVCIAPASGTIAGRFPVVAGVSFFDQLLENSSGADGMTSFGASEAAGVYAHRALTGVEVDAIAESAIGRRIGFRCVGQRASAEGDGVPPDFSDRLLLSIGTP